MKKLISLACLALVASQSFGALSLLTSRAQITETDYVEWGDLGAEGVFPTNPFLVSTHGTPFMVKGQNGSGLFWRVDQGSFWPGNMPSGSNLLYSGDALSLTGAKTCNAFGVDIQANNIGEFKATIEAFDGLGDSMGSFDVWGDSEFLSGTATFLGIRDTEGAIHRVKISVVGASGGSDFAIDRVSYECCLPVPEPASMTALGLGALALLRKKSKKA
ncbi:MAG: PEP-CTERM sorting domain-containing protein [Armatimonadetes bacterium]|nr:PEP-CTERM sorting domain-containing protein [Armatimonadota bacterium]